MNQNQKRHKSRQAVVIIHGIGEQRPMDTLRSFVDAMLPDSSSQERVKYWSKPDRMSESFELRKFTAPSSSSRPITDFFEYYWAYQMRDTKFRHILRWFLQLLFQNPRNVPRRIFPVWLISWVLFLLVGAFVLMRESIPFLNQFSAESSLLISFAPILLIPMINWVMLEFIGDAARYLDPSPENIAQRQRIRSDGIQLLRKLHASQKYDRVVIIGHSLGSVIGYDIIRHLWDEFNRKHESPLDINQDEMKTLEKMGHQLREKSEDSETRAFQEQQLKCWLEQRRMGNSWLITDFITLGSPLAHAELLLARSKQEFRDRQQERELPICPPYSEAKKYSYPLSYEVNGQPRTIRVFHHAAPFGTTRWTNMYFPGDFVGGPLREIFGEGIKDVCLKGNRPRFLNYLPNSHGWYWKKSENKPLKRGVAKKNDCSSVKELSRALDLDSKKWLP
ncbi:MAG: hypothetical protein KAS66_16510 [Candidatus Omnitrophica bacterium]|nr:hypothetical protein [Candidatus Omnitrophota bacterium]